MKWSKDLDKYYFHNCKQGTAKELKRIIDDIVIKEIERRENESRKIV